MTPLDSVLLSIRADPRRRHFFFAIIVALLIVMAFPRHNSAADEAVDELLPVLPRMDSGVPGNQADRQANQILSTGGWDSEIVADAAKHQLQRLGELLHNADQIDRSKIDHILAEGFDCTPLRPSNLEKSFDDGSMAIFRPTEDVSGLSEASKKGVDGCLAALQELAFPLAGFDSIHVHFKVFKVDVTGQMATTWAHFQSAAESSAVASSPGASGIQQNATWVCEWNLTEEEDEPRLKSIRLVAFEEIVVAAGAAKLFTDCTESVLGENESFQNQLLFGTDHWRARLLAEFGIGVFGPEGIAIGDVNGDGLDDLFVCQPGGLPNRLYIRQPDGSAVDHSVTAGVDLLDGTSCALLVDLDNDGDQDLILSVIGRIFVMSNDGGGHFEHRWSFALEQIPFSLAAADYDSDGRLDFYVCVYAAGNGPYSAGSTAPFPWHDANNGGSNHLFRNVSGFRFEDVTVETGIDVNNRRFSYAAAWEDYDNDGDQDLYVANDFGRNNLYRNDGGHFLDVASEAGVEDISAGMSVSWGDYDNDGRMDLYVSNMFSSAGNRVAYQSRFKSGLDQQTLAEFQRHARGNSLYRNKGDGSFEDVSIDAGVNMGRWAWGSLFTDLNNDGRDDLYVANGCVTQRSTDDL